MSKKVWFVLPEYHSPEQGEAGNQSREFQQLHGSPSDLTCDSRLSQYSYTSPQLSKLSQPELSQLSLLSQEDLSQSCQSSEKELSQLSQKELSQYSQLSQKELSEISQLSEELSQYSNLSEKDLSQNSQLSQRELSQYSQLSQKELSQLSQLSQKELSQYSQLSPKELSQLSLLSQKELSQYSQLTQKELSQLSLLSQKDLSKDSQILKKNLARRYTLPPRNQSQTSQKDLSQYSVSSQDLSQYSAISSMDPNSTTEVREDYFRAPDKTYSTNDSQEVSSSQQDSTDGQYGFDDANSTSSLQEEAVSTAIMEVSGELMQGKLTPHKQHSVTSESSDISDDEARRVAAGGSIAKYPESSTGMSDNDWNPYATESDTNQTPRSPRSNASDDQSRVGFVSRATINVGPPQEKVRGSTATVSMTTGEVTVGPSGRVAEHGMYRQKEEEYKPDPTSQRLDMLRYLVDKEAKEMSPRAEEERTSDPDVVRSPEPEDAGPMVAAYRDRLEQFGDEEDRESRDSPETVKSVHTEDTLSVRQSLDSRKSDEGIRESFESDRDTFGRPSGDFDPDADSRRQSGESGRSRQSTESWRSGESNLSGRQSVDSHQSQRSGQSDHSEKSGQSEQSQRSTGRSSDRSERLDLLSDGAGRGMTEVIKFENAQRVAAELEDQSSSDARGRREMAGSPVTRTKLTARLQPYNAPGIAKAAEDVPNLVGKTGYMSIAERERLLTESPDTTQEPKYPTVPRLELERTRPTHSSANLPKFSEVERSPSEISMQRVSSLFEETKMAARAAVAIPRPEPSGSEERFPLKERMDHSIHESSLMAPESRTSLERPEQKAPTRLRDSEVSRSITSEEVARVLGKYAEDETGPYTRPEPKYSEKSPLAATAYNRVDNEGESSYASASSRETGTASASSQRMDEMSDDELARRVKAILADRDNIGLTGGNGRTYQPREGLGKSEYVPRTIDYTRLQRDLEEIQDSLHDVPQPKANDSLHMLARDRIDDAGKRDSPMSDDYRSLETTGTTRGRESGASEVSQRLVWDHGADLKYDNDYDGKFLGTTTSSATLSSRPRYSSDDMVVRPISSASNDTEKDVPDLESTGTRTLTGADLTLSRSEKLVQQVLNRQAEGDLRENVEDIIARYRNERQDLYERLRTEPDPESVPRIPPEIPSSLKKPELYMTDQPADDKKQQSGLAERVYKILTDGKEDKENEDPDNKGMAKEVYKILSKDPPHLQVNGILTETTAVENEMLKKMVNRPKDDSTMEDSGLDESGESFRVEDKDIRKQLEYSQFSSPDKTGMSDMSSIRRVTSAPYSSVNNVKSLLSSQLQKVTQRNFDKSIEMRTPHRQAVNCYPVYGMELDANRNAIGNGQREAWSESEATGAEANTRPSALSSERFFLTDKDRTPVPSHLPRAEDQSSRHRTLSDPFDVSPSRRSAGGYRVSHSRSKSEEGTSASDLSQYSFHDLPSSPADNLPTSSKPVPLTSQGLVTPKLHRVQVSRNALRASVQSTASTTINKTSSDWGYECYTSDSSGPCCYSDSSDGNIHRHHGYHMYANTKVNPFVDKDNSAHPKTKHLVVQSTNISVTASESEGSPDRSDDASASPSKRQRSEGRGRPRLRHRSPPPRKLKSPESGSLGEGLGSRSLTEGLVSRSLPSQRVAPPLGGELQSPITRDDVYELLCRSQQQEERLHELRSKLFQHEHGIDGDNVGQTGSVGRNHGDVGMRPAKTRSHSMHQLRTQGYSRRDGSPTDSDTSRSRKGSQLRPYRPPGSRDMYYTESGDDTNESGTTLESTHPGSDDAVPPYIPRQFLGSREEEPARHPTGIYGRKDKDDLSTIDENSIKLQLREIFAPRKDRAVPPTIGSRPAAKLLGGYPEIQPVVNSLSFPIKKQIFKDDKEKALSLSAGSNHSNPSKTASGDSWSGRKSPSIRSNPDSGLGATSTSLPHDSRETLKSDLGSAVTRSRSQHDSNPGNLAARSRSPLDSNPGNPAPRAKSPYESSSGSLATRSPVSNRDNPSRASAEPLRRPGLKTREEFQREFEVRERALQEELARYRKLERENDNLGASVRSDPGGVLEVAGMGWEYRESIDRQEFRELQPEPAYPQERLKNSRSRSDTDLAALSPTESQKYSSPMQPGTRFLELSTQPSPIFHHDSITYQPRGRAPAPEDLPRVPADTQQRYGEPAELPNVDDRDPSPVQPLEPVELGADPRRMGGMRRPAEDRKPSDRPKSPLQSRQKEMERELEKLNRELTEQVQEIQEKKEEPVEGEEFEDQFPPSKKAQVLREVLEQEYQDNVPPNINDMWTRFKEQKEHSMSESSLNSDRLDALSGLLENPTKHSASILKHLRYKSREDVEKDELVKMGKGGAGEKGRRMSEEKAVEERSSKRQEMKQRSGLSEEESNGSYTELLMDKDRRKSAERVRKGGKRDERKERRNKENKSPDKAKRSSKAVEKDKPNDKAVVTDIRHRNLINSQHSDTMDTLFSIPEDASFEQSPSKAESELKSRQRRHRHVIDPLMKKLRDKIKLQRDKIDKERRKELQRMEKLKKLQMLLTAKRGGQLSDKAIHVELDNVSTTSCYTQSESSHIMSDTTLTAGSTAGESEISSQESSTLMDSTLSTIKLQPKKYPADDFSRPRKAFDSDSTETSDFSNIVVERVVEGKAAKSERKSSNKKSGSKSKKSKVGEDGKRIRKEKKKKEKIQFDDISEEDLRQQLKQYQRQQSPDGRRAYSAKSPDRRLASPERRRMQHSSSPDRRRLVQDASTMFPSPITVSPPSRRRIRDVLMRSEAIQTSPSIRSSSPTHAYDEVPVAPVPVMSSKSRSSRRRPSTSPPRSAKVTQRKSSNSPSRSKPTTPRQYSRSPPRGKTSKLPSEKSRRPPAPVIRKPLDESMWKVESELPPSNSMFTPESPVSSLTALDKPAETWFIPMNGSKPWQKSQKERQAFAVRQEAWQPKSVSQSTWNKILHADIGKNKDDPNDISRDTKFDLDPDGQPMRDGEDVSDSEESYDEDRGKPLSKMTLQEAFMVRKQCAVSRVRERQKRLNLAAEERRMQAFLQQEREKLFQEERKKEANPDAHPYSENLHKPARRVITKEEMKEITGKKYKKLPEVLQQEKLKKREEDYSLNRLKARLYNRRVQKRVLQKAQKWGR